MEIHVALSELCVHVTNFAAVPVRKESKTWPAARYLYGRVIPNVFFHCTTTYNILRHNGVEIGKADFLGPVTD